jgi:hypothetical protein
MRIPKIESLNRWSAAAIHLIVCALIALLVYLAIRFTLYPNHLLAAVGGLEIFLIVLGCDVVLGPLLTLLVFKRGKKSLKFDLSVIAIIQVCALLYGLWILWSGRPVYIAALGHRFDVVQAAELLPKNIAEAKEPLPMFGPRWTGIAPPADKNERDKVMWDAVVGGGDYGHLPKYHGPVEAMYKEIIERAESISNLKGFNKGRETEIDQWLAKNGTDATRAKFQGLKARTQDMTVVVDGSTGKIIGIAPFKPW